MTQKQRIGPVSRRDFLRLSGSVVGAGLAYLTLRPIPVEAAGVLPPGAQPSRDFQAACLRCGRCAAICDQQAIEISLDGTPFINGLNGWCDFCMCCGDVCPSEALVVVDPETTKIGTAVIDRDRCLAWNQFNACRHCMFTCNELQQAIWIDEKRRPYVDTSLCNGCGACTYICPQSFQEGVDKKYGKAVTLRQLGSA